MIYTYHYYCDLELVSAKIFVDYYYGNRLVFLYYKT
jgi:hypothetical protein